MGVLIDLQPSAGPALVVGGGAIALRKARNLSDGGFAVTVIAPEVGAELAELAGVSVEQRPFEDDDISVISKWSMVFACTDDRAVNERVGELARAASIPVVVTDAQEESTFFTPATVRDGEASVAVSTGGADPALAADLRRRVVEALGPGWGAGVEAARAAREARRSQGE